MFCPQCKAEYRQGFTRCSDCDVDLVYALAEAQQPPEGPEGPDAVLRSVWGGSSTVICADLCAKLKDAEIPFKVIRREDRLFNINAYPAIEIVVPLSFREKALDLIGDPNDAMPADEAEAESVLGLPAQDDVAEPEKDAGRYSEDWYPEDATMEVWSESGNDVAWMIEASLRENRIRSRTDTSEDGSRKVFVLPEDESRACEIVREITEGAPPE